MLLLLGADDLVLNALLDLRPLLLPFVLLVLFERLFVEELEYLAQLDKLLELHFDLLECNDHLVLGHVFAAVVAVTHLLLLVLCALDQLIDALVDAFHFITGGTKAVQVLVEGSLMEALLPSGGSKASCWRSHAQARGTGWLLIRARSVSSVLDARALRLATTGSSCLTRDGLVGVDQHVLVVAVSVIPCSKRLLKQSNVVVELVNLPSSHSNLSLALLLHLLKCLRAVLEEIHLEQVVLFKLLEVLPELFLLNRHLIVAI